MTRNVGCCIVFVYVVNHGIGVIIGVIGVIIRVIIGVIIRVIIGVIGVTIGVIMEVIGIAMLLHKILCQYECPFRWLCLGWRHRFPFWQHVSLKQEANLPYK